MAQLPKNFSVRDGRNVAEALTAPEFASMQIVGHTKVKLGVREDDLPALMAALSDQTQAVLAGDMTRAESMLINQATALQSLFTRLTLRAFEQPHMPNFEGYLRLALRAQNQCRATLETLSGIKNPAVVIAKQANLSVGSPQQVNNYLSQAKPHSLQSQLLEEPNDQRLDTRTTAATGSPDQSLAPVGRIYRTSNTRR